MRRRPPAGPSPNRPSGGEALKDYNVPQRLAEFVEQVLAQGRQTRGRHVMLTMGSDFQFQSAEDWYRNLDKLIRAATQGAAALAASLYESVDASFVISLCTVSDGEKMRFVHRG